MANRNVKTVESALVTTSKPVKSVVDNSFNIKDGMENLVAGMGTSRDKRNYTNYSIVIPKSQQELENIFRSSWLAKAIVNTVPEDMVREWLEVRFDDKDKDHLKIVENLACKLKVKSKVKEALSWSRLYGGSVIVIGVKGQKDLSVPLDITKIQKDSLTSLHVLDRWRITGSPELTKDMDSPNFGLPEWYILAESSVRVHHTRVLRFNGEKVPYFIWHKNGRWDDPTLQHVFDALLNADTASQSVSSMLFEATVDVINVDKLAETIAMKNGENNIVKRFQLAALMKSFNRVLLLDKDELFSKHQTSFSGIKDVVEQFKVDVCGACGIPMTRLFGQSAQGLNATGEGDLRNYYDSISARQELELLDQMNYLYEIIVRSSLGVFPDDFELEFKPLWQLSETEQSTVDKTNSERDKSYLEMGVITEGVIARQLKANRTYSELTDEDIALAEELALAEPEETDIETDLNNKDPKPIENKASI